MGVDSQKNESLTVHFGTLWQLVSRRGFGESEIFWNTTASHSQRGGWEPPWGRRVRHGALLSVLPFLSPQQGCFSSQGKTTERAAVLEKGPHLWGPHTAQPPLLYQDHRFSNSASQKSFRVTQDRHDEKPDRDWGWDSPTYTGLWAEDSFTSIFKPTSMENPFCSLSLSPSPVRQVLLQVKKSRFRG